MMKLLHISDKCYANWYIFSTDFRKDYVYIYSNYTHIYVLRVSANIIS